MSCVWYTFTYTGIEVIEKADNLQYSYKRCDLVAHKNQVQAENFQ